MLNAAHAFTRQTDSQQAGAQLGEQLRTSMGTTRPDVVIVFASSHYDYTALLSALEAAIQPRMMLGCSSAGEFTSSDTGSESACALALQDSNMELSVSIGRGLRNDRMGAAEALVSGFRGMANTSYRYRTALLLTDALAGYTDDLLDHLTTLTAGTYQFFGGGAGDDAQFQETHVFYGTQAYTDAVVALEFLSHKPIGLGVAHGWSPASDSMRVTATSGMNLQSMNATPAVEVFEDHALSTAQTFDQANPMPFFLHNVVGIQTDQGYKLRVPLGVGEDGCVPCASDIPTGTLVHIMGATPDSAIHAASLATERAMEQIQGSRPKVALFFDCVATRLRMGQNFNQELGVVQEQLGEASYMGFNTYGQIARVEGQFSGFHNCTAVVCILPE